MDISNIIRQAAFELFESKPFTAISVQEILDKAHVSRGSFYTYYRDKYELMHLYFQDKIGDLLVGGFDGTNWFEQQQRCFQVFLSRSPYLNNVKLTKGQDSFWDFLYDYSRRFYVSVKTHNNAGPLSLIENATAEGIAAASVHFYDLCLETPQKYSAQELTKALEAMIPLSFRDYQEK